MACVFFASISSFSGEPEFIKSVSEKIATACARHICMAASDPDASKPAPSARCDRPRSTSRDCRPHVVFSSYGPALEVWDLMKARGDADVPIVCYTLVLGRKTNRTISELVPSAVSPQDNWSSTASSGKGNDWRTRQRVVLDLHFTRRSPVDPVGKGLR